MNKIFLLIFMYSISLLTGVQLMAQDAAPAAPANGGSKILDMMYNNILVVLAVLALLLVVMAGINLIWALIEMQKIKLIEKYGPEVTEKAGWSQKTSIWSTIYGKLSGLKPLEQEKDIEFDHDFDGIRELDNSLPPWWVYLFYITIFWGLGYLVYYHVGGWGADQATEYVSSMEEAEIQKAAFLATQGDKVDENTVELVLDEASLAEGKEVFLANCVACHGSNAEGNSVGPNLTDAYWIHGGSIKNVFSTIKYGVQEKGMQAWQSQLRPAVIQKVASYIMSLQGSNPPNAKAPQGDLYVEKQGDTPTDTLNVQSTEVDTTVQN